MELRFVSAKCPDYAMLAKKLDEYYFTLVGDVHLKYAAVNDPKNMACIIVTNGKIHDQNTSIPGKYSLSNTLYYTRSGVSIRSEKGGLYFRAVG